MLYTSEDFRSKLHSISVDPYESSSVVSNFPLHLHTEKHLALLIIAGYQMAITSTLRATFGVEVGRNPALKSLF